MQDQHKHPEAKHIPLPELLRVFLTLGFLGFGGPAAHLALMERELVGRRGWLSRSDFLDLLAAINLVPGPNSTEMALHIGLLKHGFAGMMAAAIGFIGPAVLLSSILGMIYVSAGTVPAVASLLERDQAGGSGVDPERGLPTRQNRHRQHADAHTPDRRTSRDRPDQCATDGAFRA